MLAPALVYIMLLVGLPFLLALVLSVTNSSAGSLDFSFVGEFPEVVYLVPDQSDVVHGLIEALVRRWPSCPPYGGMFDKVVPHLTVVDTPDAALRERARAEVAVGLPVRSEATEASLWVHEEGAPWGCLARFPLAPAE